MLPPLAPKKQTQSNPVLSAVEWANFKPGDGFSSYYKRDCQGLRKRWHYELIGDKIV